VRALSAETVSAPDAVELPDDDLQRHGLRWRGLGTGFAAVERALETRLHARLASVDAAALPHAADVARLGAIAFARGEALPPERLEPAYLRNQVALTLEQQQALRASR